MALLTISEASKQFKIARSYLYKKINNGELSTQLNDQGVKVVQYIDLVRVFGENNINAENSPQPVHEDKRGQDLRTKEDDKKTSSILLFIGILIIILLIGLISIFGLKFSGLI